MGTYKLKNGTKTYWFKSVSSLRKFAREHGWEMRLKKSGTEENTWLVID